MKHEYKKTIRKIFLVPVAVILILLSGSVLLFRLYDSMHSQQVQKEAFEAFSFTDEAEADVKPENAEEGPILASEIEPEETPQPDEPAENPPVMINFSNLKLQNEDVYCWLYIEDTPINFEVLQSTDNSFYLNHNMKGERSYFGSIFTDYRCAKDFSDCNTVIFGHNMQNGTMFGVLDEYENEEFFKEHPVMWIFAESGIYKAEFLACYVHTSGSDLYKLPSSEDDFFGVLENAVARTAADSGVEIDRSAHYITLSTCGNEYAGARVGLIGKISYVRSYP